MFKTVLIGAALGLVAVIATTADQRPPWPETCNISPVQLPDDVLRLILGRVTATSELAPLARPYPVVRDLIHDRHRVRRLLLDKNVPEDELPSLVSHLIDLWTSSLPIDWLHLDLTVRNALSLYHRLLAAQSLDLVSQLVIHFDVFRDVVSAPPDHNEDLALELHKSLPDLRLPSHPDQIPAVLLQVLVDIVDDVVTDNRYPPPFDRVFPNNTAIARNLLVDTPVELRHLFADFNVVVAFLRYGIRFPPDLFPAIEDIDQIKLIYPLLSKKTGEGQPPQFRDFWMFWEYLLYQRSEHAAALLSVPEFVDKIERQPVLFLQVIDTVIREGFLDLFRKIKSMSFFSGLINQQFHDVSIFRSAIKYNRFQIATCLLERDDFLLTESDGSPLKVPFCWRLPCPNPDAFINFIVSQPKLLPMMESSQSNLTYLCDMITSKLIIHDRADLLERLLSAIKFGPLLVNHVHNSFSDPTSLLSFERRGLLLSTAQVQTIGDVGVTLLHLALKHGAFNCATVVQSVQIVSQPISPLYMLAYTDRYVQLLDWLGQSPVSAWIRAHSDVLVLILNQIMRAAPELTPKIEQLSIVGEILDGRDISEIANSARAKQRIESDIKKALEMNSNVHLVAILGADPSPADTLNQEDDLGRTLIHHACANKSFLCYPALFRVPGLKKLRRSDLAKELLPSNALRNAIDRIGQQ